MQSKTTWGVRHLLVSTGVISLLLSVAAPAALADKPEGPQGREPDHAEQATGATRVEICHNGQVIEVDDDGQLGGHAKHGDREVTDENRGLCVKSADDTLEEDDELVEICIVGTLVEVPESELTGDETRPVERDGVPTCAGESIIDDAELVDVCRAGQLLLAVPASEVGAGDVEPEMSEGEPTCPEEVIGGGDKVEVCHEESVIEIAVEALGEHLGHGDAEMVEGATCPVIVDEKVRDTDIDPVVLDDPEAVVEVPVEHPPATPVQPIPAAQPRPVVIISTHTVTKPAVERNEVLGAVTTRTPTPGVGALDPGTHTAASITALAATGADGTKVLAVAGVVLLLSGFGLQVSGRRRMRSAMVEA